MSNIEDDVKIVKRYLKNSSYKESDSDFFKNGGWEIVDLEIAQAMSNIMNEREQNIKKIKELEEKNRMLALEGSRVRLDLYIKENYISKKKIKEKLKEVIRLRERTITSEGYNIANGEAVVLQELLEEGE